MFQAIMTLKNFIMYAYDCFDSVTFDFPVSPFGTISLMDILTGFLILGMIINLFWKGARA